jgi:glyoxylase-like metal-dependent hydrolase (beta-lactamase superfamily II)
LKETLAAENAVIGYVLITHWHGDHIGGLKDLATLNPPPKICKNLPADGMTNIDDGNRFVVNGAAVRAFHCPGHTKDHMAFVLEEEDALFTGDNVLGHGTAVFEDLPVYIKSLTGMAAQTKGRGYPGHGEVLESATTRINEYVAHRTQREREVMEVLLRSTEGTGLGSMDLVRIIYQDTPENLHFAASRGVVMILEKLLTEGKVSYDEAGATWAPTSKAVL